MGGGFCSRKVSANNFLFFPFRLFEMFYKQILRMGGKLFLGNHLNSRTVLFVFELSRLIGRCLNKTSLIWSNTASTGRLSPSARVISCSTNHCLVLRSCCLLFYSSVISFPDLTVFLRRKYYYFTLMLGCLIVQRLGGSQPRLIVTQDSGIWMLRSLFTGRAFIPNLSVDKGILPVIRLKIIKIT